MFEITNKQLTKLILCRNTMGSKTSKPDSFADGAGRLIFFFFYSKPLGALFRRDIKPHFSFDISLASGLSSTVRLDTHTVTGSLHYTCFVVENTFSVHYKNGPECTKQSAFIVPMADAALVERGF
jgi:hypothetical protein